MYNMRFLNTSDNFNKAWHTQVDIESSTENEQYIPEKKKRPFADTSSDDSDNGMCNELFFF